MEKKEIIDYVMNSPQNTNPAILGQFLDKVSGGGSMEPLIINVDTSDANWVVCDKTYGEIKEALEGGRTIYFKIISEYEGESYSSFECVTDQVINLRESLSENNGSYNISIYFYSQNNNFYISDNSDTPISFEDYYDRYPGADWS